MDDIALFIHICQICYQQKVGVIMKNTVIVKVFTHFLVSFLLFSTFINMFGTNLYPTLSTSMPKVVIDAGHGGIDRGSFGIATGTAESELNLEYAKTLQEKLGNFEIATILTRADSEGLYGDTSKGFKKRDMAKRKEISEDFNADLLVSLHCNYSTAKSPRGVVIYYNESVPLSKTLALELQKNIATLATVKKVRIDSEKMYMTHSIDLPSVLIECGFLSNTTDEQLLLNVEYRNRLTEKIATSLKNILFTTNPIA